jgi:hypothetical protein
VKSKVHEPAADGEADDGERIAGTIDLRLRRLSVAEAAAKDPRGHAAARVQHAEMKLDQITARPAAQLDADAATLGSLDRPMQQGAQDLLDATRVTDDDAGDIWLGSKREVQALATRLLDDHPQARLHAGADVERMQGQLEVAGLDDGRVEDVIEEPGDPIGSGFDDRRELALLARRGGRGEHAGGADDGVELVSQLVGEIPEQVLAGDDGERRLRAVGWDRLRRPSGLVHLVHGLSQYSWSSGGCATGTNISSASSTPSERKCCIKADRAPVAVW